MRDVLRFVGGGVLVTAAGLWKLKGPHWSVVAELGPLPDLTASDILAIPVAVAGLALLGAAPQHGRRRTAAGLFALVGSVIWVTSDWPWDDPLVPGLQWGRHGVHVLDLLAIVPLATGLVALWPRRSRRAACVFAHRA